MFLFLSTGIVMIVVSLITNNLEYFRTIRTTFWTRKLTDKRPDEQDFNEIKETPFMKGVDNIVTIENELENINGVNSITISNSNTSVKIKDKFEMQIENESNRKEKKSKRRKIADLLLNIFCGIESKKVDETQQKIEESKRRLESINSLNQTKFEKYILNVNLVFIILLYIFLMTFFSIPPQKLIFKHVNFNLTHNHYH